MASLYTPEPQRAGLDWLAGMTRDAQSLWQNQQQIENARKQIALAAQNQQLQEQHFWTEQARLKGQEDFQNRKFLYEIKKDQQAETRQGILDQHNWLNTQADNARADRAEARLGAPNDAQRFFGTGGTGGAAPPFPTDTAPPATPTSSADTPQQETAASLNGVWGNIPVPGFTGGFMMPPVDVPVRRAEPVTENPYSVPSQAANTYSAKEDLTNVGAPTRAPNGGPALLPDNIERPPSGGLYDLKPGSPLPPGKVWGADNSIYTRKGFGKSAQYTLYEEAGPPPPKEAWPEGKYPVAVLNEGTNVPKSYKYEAVPTLSKENQTALNKASEMIAKNDPQFISLSTSVAKAEGSLREAGILYRGLDPSDPNYEADKVRVESSRAQLAESARVLKEQKDQKLAEIKMQAIRKLSPKIAAAMDQYYAATAGQDVAPLVAPDLMPPTPAAPPSIKDKLRQGLATP